MKSKEMKAEVGTLFNILDSKYWFNVRLEDGHRSRVALTGSQKYQGHRIVTEGSTILVRVNLSVEDPYFLVDFVSLIK